MRGGDSPLQILLTNDDGVFAPGLRALRKELRRLGDVTVIAPAVEQSGVGHSITLLTPLVVKQVDDDDGATLGRMVDGSPADSLKLAICELMPRPPDLIVSGINSGSNAGINVLYSGTVAAAIEGAFFQCTSIALSLQYTKPKPLDFARAAEHAAKVVEQIVRHPLSRGSLFNVNIPSLDKGPVKGVVMFLTGPDKKKYYAEPTDSTGYAELLVPVRFTDGKAKFVVEYVW